MRLHEIRIPGHSRLLGSLAVTTEDLALVDIISKAPECLTENIPQIFQQAQQAQINWTPPDISAVYTPWPSSVAADDSFAERLWFDCKPDTLEGRVLPFFAQFKELIRRLSVVCSEGPFLRSSEHTAFYNILKFPLVSNSFTRCQLLSQSEIAPALRSAANAVWCTEGMGHGHKIPFRDILSFADSRSVLGDVTGKLHLWQQEILKMRPAEVTNGIIRAMALLQIVLDRESILDRESVCDASEVENQYVRGIYIGLVALGHLEVDGLTASTHLHITRFLAHFHRIREDTHHKYLHPTDHVFAHAGLSLCLRVFTGDHNAFTISKWPSLLADLDPGAPGGIDEVTTIWTSAYRSHFALWSGRDNTGTGREKRLEEIQQWWSEQLLNAAFLDLLIGLSAVPTHKKQKCTDQLKTISWNNSDELSLFGSICVVTRYIKRLVPRDQRPPALVDLVDLPATDPVPLRRQSFVDADFLECAEKMVADFQTFAPGPATLALGLALFALFNWYWRNGYYYIQLVAFLAQSAKIRRNIHRLPADISVLLSPAATLHYNIDGLCDNDQGVLSHILDSFANLGHVGTTGHLICDQQRSSLYDPFTGDMAGLTSLEASLQLLPGPGPDPDSKARIELAKAVWRTCDTLVALSSVSNTSETRQLRRAMSAVGTFKGAITARTKLGIKNFPCRDPKFLNLQENYQKARQIYVCSFQETVSKIREDFTTHFFKGNFKAEGKLGKTSPPLQTVTLPTARIAEVVRVSKEPQHSERPEHSEEQPPAPLPLPPRRITNTMSRVLCTVENTQQLRCAALKIGAINVNSCI